MLQSFNGCGHSTIVRALDYKKNERIGKRKKEQREITVKDVTAGTNDLAYQLTWLRKAFLFVAKVVSMTAVIA